MPPPIVHFDLSGFGLDTSRYALLGRLDRPDAGESNFRFVSDTAVDTLLADPSKAREQLGWAPRHDFATAVGALAAGEDPRSALTRDVGVNGYHPVSTGIYTVRD